MKRNKKGVKRVTAQKNTRNQFGVSVNRQHKSQLFAMVFQQKPELLELYNAMTGKNYTDPELLEINTLENAIYMAMRNDISFVIGTQQYFYEHQSTPNPNMPLRFLLYTSDLYSGTINSEMLYGRKQIPLPEPHYVVFYNGIEKRPEVETLKLSDLYNRKTDHPELELTVTVLNINPGNNQKLIEASRTLRDYSEYIQRIRVNMQSMEIAQAVEKATTDCITDGILDKFLRKYRSEAIKVSIYEFNEERYYALLRKEAIEEGREEGRNRYIIDLICKKHAKGMSVEQIARDLETDVSEIQRVMEAQKIC